MAKKLKSSVSGENINSPAEACNKSLNMTLGDSLYNKHVSIDLLWWILSQFCFRASGDLFLTCSQINPLRQSDIR